MPYKAKDAQPPPNKKNINDLSKKLPNRNKTDKNHAKRLHKKTHKTNQNSNKTINNKNNPIPIHRTPHKRNRLKKRKKLV